MASIIPPARDRDPKAPAVEVDVARPPQPAGSNARATAGATRGRRSHKPRGAALANGEGIDTDTGQPGANGTSEPPEPFRATGKQLGSITGKGFMPGRSGNPSGKPRGLVTLVREQTDDGRLLVSIMVGIARAEPMEVQTIFPAKEPEKPPTIIRYQRTPTPDEVMEAVKWLGDRGWGKPPLQLEVAPGRAFMVQHRSIPPGRDPLALPPGEEVSG